MPGNALYVPKIRPQSLCRSRVPVLKSVENGQYLRPIQLCLNECSHEAIAECRDLRKLTAQPHAITSSRMPNSSRRHHAQSPEQRRRLPSPQMPSAPLLGELGGVSDWMAEIIVIEF
jgi:hypothetical protein